MDSSNSKSHTCSVGKNDDDVVRKEDDERRTQKNEPKLRRIFGSQRKERREDSLPSLFRYFLCLSILLLLVLLQSVVSLLQYCSLLLSW